VLKACTNYRNSVCPSVSLSVTISVGQELTQMTFNSRVNSVIVSCEFELIHLNNCELFGIIGQPYWLHWLSAWLIV